METGLKLIDEMIKHEHEDRAHSDEDEYEDDDDFGGRALSPSLNMCNRAS